MCREAGITEKKTNHSLRATGTTALFRANVHEKLIRDVTGHKSNSLQLYQRSTEEQKKAVSKILVQGSERFTNLEKENIPVPVVPRMPQHTSVPQGVPFVSSNPGTYNQCNFAIDINN